MHRQSCPLGIQRDVCGRHGCEGVSRGETCITVPASEGVASLGRCCRSADRRAEGLGDRTNRRAAIAVEGDGVVIHRPLGIQHDVCCRHGCEGVGCGETCVAVPAAERVASLGRICRSADRRAEGLGHRCNHRATIAVERDGVVVHCPLGIQGDVRSRHGCEGVGCGETYIAVPAAEGVASLGRCCRSADRRAEGLGDRTNRRATIAVERDGVIIHCPLGIQRDVCCRHGCEGVGCGETCVAVPAAEGVASLGRCCRSADHRAKGLGDRTNRRAAIAVEGDGVAVGCPLGIQCDVCAEGVDHAVSVVRACAIRESVPASEGVACACECIERQGGRDIRNLRSHRASPTVGVEGHRVHRQSCPLGIQRDIRSRHGCEGVRRGETCIAVPAAEGVTSLGRCCRSADRRAEGLGDRGNRRAAIAVERDGVAVGCPLGIQRNVRSRHGREGVRRG